MSTAENNPSSHPAAAAAPPAPAAPQAPGAEPSINIEADPDFDDEGFDDKLSTFTESLTSSVLNFPTEYGRRYHAYRAGVYNFPNDAKEMERLDMMHLIIIRAIDDRHFLAPIDPDKMHRILDIGTGTGSWAIDIGDMFPRVEVIGNDLSPVQTNWVPPNVKFEIDDVESEWAYDFKFDYIFSRYMAGSIADWPQLMRRVYENLSPGGWAEFQDFDLTYRSDDGTLTPDFHTYHWAKKTVETISGPLIGRECSPGPRLKGWLESAGFVDVTEKAVKIPIGPWARDPALKELGMLNLTQLLAALEAVSLKPLAAAGYRQEETLALVANVRAELKSKAFHSYYTLHVVYGKKPT